MTVPYLTWRTLAQGTGSLLRRTPIQGLKSSHPRALGGLVVLLDHIKFLQFIAGSIHTPNKLLGIPLPIIRQWQFWWRHNSRINPQLNVSVGVRNITFESLSPYLVIYFHIAREMQTINVSPNCDPAFLKAWRLLSRAPRWEKTMWNVSQSAQNSAVSKTLTIASHSFQFIVKSPIAIVYFRA